MQLKLSHLAGRLSRHLPKHRMIRRDGLVRLFASVLYVDADGQHWLRTPVEFGRIEVEDAPFIITGLHAEGTGRARSVTLTDNLDRAHLG